VLVGSLFLAGTSYFIPIPEQTAPEPSQIKRVGMVSDKAFAKPLRCLDFELDYDFDQDEARVLLTGRLKDRRRFIVGSFNTLLAGSDKRQGNACDTMAELMNSMMVSVNPITCSLRL
jgi:hypothetical protein